MPTLTTRLLLLACIALALLVWTRLHADPCAVPIAYRLGKVDERFGLSESEVREALQAAEQFWEAAVGRNLFDYNPTAKLAVDLVFDERQQSTRVKERLAHKLEATRASHDTLAQQHRTWHTFYQDKAQAYDVALQAYSQRLQAYNAEVQRWNAQGGAPPQAQAALDTARWQLQALKTTLDAEQSHLREVAATLQAMEQQGRQIVETYNRQVKSYNQLYGTARHFHKGEYNGTRITIYQFYDTADLALVLAHEFGHALGLGHVEAPRAVMHDILGEQDVQAMMVTPEDVQALKSFCE